MDEQAKLSYRQTMQEWLGCEEIVRQREKEHHAAALAKCSTSASMDSSSQKMVHLDSTVSSEVKQLVTLIMNWPQSAAFCMMKKDTAFLAFKMNV